MSKYVCLFNTIPPPPRHTTAWRHRTRNPTSKSARAPSAWEEFRVRDHKLAQGHLRVSSFLLHIHNWLQAQNRVQNVWSEKTKEEEARAVTWWEREAQIFMNIWNTSGREEKKKYVATRPLLTTRRFLSVTLGKLYFHLLDALSAEFHNEINT